MRRSLSFRTRAHCSETNALVDVLVIYFGQTAIDISVIGDEIQNALKVKEPIPDVIYVLCHGAQAQTLVASWEQNSIRTESLLKRGGTDSMDYLKEFAFYKYENGGFQCILRPVSSTTHSISVEKLLEDGLAHLVSTKGAYQIAPTGHVFKHPSGKRSRQFLLASELLSDEVDAYFVALCICSAAGSKILNASRLYIDTMGIYPVARAIRDILSISPPPEELAPFEICSFHSHDGLGDFQPPDIKTAVVLISASTSGNMAMQMGREKKFPNDHVITILDVDHIDRFGLVVYSHKKYQNDSAHPSFPQPDGYETTIELVGEYFAARGKRPRSLTLTLAHAPKNLKKTLDEFSQVAGCQLQKQRTNGSSAIDPITLSQSAIINSEIFKPWLRDELRLRTPASVSHILATQGDDSLSLARDCALVLHEITGRNFPVLRHDQKNDLRDQKASGVLICTALVGNGHALRVTARDIRELVPKASRHFVVGFGLPDTLDSWERLRQFLTQSGDAARPYLFACWRYLPIGIKRPHDSWTRYAKLMQKLEHVTTGGNLSLWSQIDIPASLTFAMELIENAADTMLPDSKGSNLRLTEGFVYWDPTAEQLALGNHNALSYLAISSVLQYAREFDNPLKRLKSTLYETVVLDPENFLRFNDGVLQACLLRAANSFELDYSISPEQSQSLREILEKIFINNSGKYGEAALEFAVAFASGHLKLTDADTYALIKSVISTLETSALSGLLFYAWLSLPKSVRFEN